MFNFVQVCRAGGFVFTGGYLAVFCGFDCFLAIACICLFCGFCDFGFLVFLICDLRVLVFLVFLLLSWALLVSVCLAGCYTGGLCVWLFGV